MYDFKEFYRQNRDFIIPFIIVTILCFAGIWFVHDYGRNEPVYTNTDGKMADLEGRMSGIEQRVDSMQKRLDETQKTIDGIAERVERSRENAEIVAGGIEQTEGRLDDAIQRSGRIQNLIDEIERANRPGTQDSPKTDMAK